MRERGPAEIADAALEAVPGPAWLHLDLDALDQDELPAVTSRQPMGLGRDELVHLLRPLLGAPWSTGVSLADLEPDRDSDGRYAHRVVEAFAEAWPA